MERAHIFARTLNLPLGQERLDPLDLVRGVIVLGCSLALMMAGPVLPL